MELAIQVCLYQTPVICLLGFWFFVRGTEVLCKLFHDLLEVILGSLLPLLRREN